jgi:hypothetical protein
MANKGLNVRLELSTDLLRSLGGSDVNTQCTDARSVMRVQAQAWARLHVCNFAADRKEAPNIESVLGLQHAPLSAVHQYMLDMHLPQRLQ